MACTSGDVPAVHEEPPQSGVISTEQAKREDTAIVTIQAAHRGQRARVAHSTALKQLEAEASVGQGGEGTASLAWAALR